MTSHGKPPETFAYNNWNTVKDAVKLKPKQGAILNEKTKSAIAELRGIQNMDDLRAACEKQRVREGE